MVRFVKGLFGSFGSNKQKPEEPQKKQQPSQKTSQKKREAYFLDSDAAKTFGNMESMRQGMGEKKDSSTTSSVEPNQSQSSSQSQEAQTQRRRPDKNMDEFRNIARDIKKK